MAETLNSLEIKVKYLETLKKKYCPTILIEINAYNPKTTPSASLEMISYRNLTETGKIEKQKKGFFEQEFIENYLNQKWKVELYNRDSFYQLYELLAKNPDKAHEITQKLNQFKQAILKTVTPYSVLTINFSKFEYANSAQTKEDNNQTELFFKKEEAVEWDE